MSLVFHPPPLAVTSESIRHHSPAQFRPLCRLPIGESYGMYRMASPLTRRLLVRIHGKRRLVIIHHMRGTCLCRRRVVSRAAMRRPPIPSARRCGVAVAQAPCSAHTTYRVCDFNHFLRGFCCRNHINGCFLYTIITIIGARRAGNTLKTGSVLQGCAALGVRMYVGCVNKPHQWGLSIVHPDL